MRARTRDILGKIGLWLGLGLGVESAFARERRFPPPDFESGYHLPGTATPAARALALQYLDVAVLAAALGAALWLIYNKRSRRGLFWLSLFCLAYFGFYRKGCICPIGAPQNIAYGLFNGGYAVPLSVIAFFALPLVVGLFAGRAFCAAVCPHGALQDFFLIKPLRVRGWLEEALGMVPFFFLGAGVAYAAAGSDFVICRYDPFVPLFRRSGSLLLLMAGAALLLLGMFVGRPFCRFACPYGALLKLASLLSKWRVRVTPDNCTQCRLCEDSCPFGVIRQPRAGTIAPHLLQLERRRLGWLLVALPVLVGLGAWGGGVLGPVAARLDPRVALAEFYLRQQQHPVSYGVMTPERLSLERVEKDPEAIISAAAAVQGRLGRITILFGAWVGLVLGLKLIGLSVVRKRADYEPDRGGCFACARCFNDCPSQRIRMAANNELPLNRAEFWLPGSQTALPLCGQPGMKR